MVHRYPWVRNPNAPTPAEVRSVLKVRADCLDAATGEGRLDGPLPVRWRVGWRGIITWMGRDRDGSMKASVTIYDQNSTKVYVRYVRLCKHVRLKRNFS
jgi:hypothetical protein